jgi:hypothetical protein
MLESYLETQDIKWTSLRPQYIYGDNTNKRINVDWFVDRVMRDRTIPLPGTKYTRRRPRQEGRQPRLIVATSHAVQVTASRWWHCRTWTT